MFTAETQRKARKDVNGVNNVNVARAVTNVTMGKGIRDQGSGNR
jgi:hypothetical protein